MSCVHAMILHYVMPCDIVLYGTFDYFVANCELASLPLRSGGPSPPHAQNALEAAAMRELVHVRAGHWPHSVNLQEVRSGPEFSLAANHRARGCRGIGADDDRVAYGNIAVDRKLYSFKDQAATRGDQLRALWDGLIAALVAVFLFFAELFKKRRKRRRI